MGSFVPASACRLGPIDAIHTRIGAADDLANAQSTFMLEMTEAAAIVHAATEHSLVLMDEIGRGTSTFDGLALAGAIASQLHDRNRAFTLFATHYFELTGLSGETRRRAERACGRRRGCGLDGRGRRHRLPAPDRARPGQPQLRRAGGAAGRHAGAAGAPGARDAGGAGGEQQRAGRRRSTCSRRRRRRRRPSPRAVDRRCDALDPDTLSPREALDALYRLKKLRKESAS